MTTKKHRLPKQALLDYALQGARAEMQGAACHSDGGAYADFVRKDVAEIRRRIKLVNSAQARKGGEQS